MEPIVRKHGAKRSGYTDDIKSIYIIKDINKVYEKLKKDYYKLLEYREAKGSPFNLKKTEV